MNSCQAFIVGPLILRPKRAIVSAIHDIPRSQNTDLQGYVDLDNFKDAFYETLKKITLQQEEVKM